MLNKIRPELALSSSPKVKVLWIVHNILTVARNRYDARARMSVYDSAWGAQLILDRMNNEVSIERVHAIH